jgi:hypothetical protein
MDTEVISWKQSADLVISRSTTLHATAAATMMLPSLRVTAKDLIADCATRAAWVRTMLRPSPAIPSMETRPDTSATKTCPGRVGEEMQHVNAEGLLDSLNTDMGAAAAEALSHARAEQSSETETSVDDGSPESK